MRFKALRGSPKGKAQRGQYLLAVDLGRYIYTSTSQGILNESTVVCINAFKNLQVHKSRKFGVLGATAEFEKWDLLLNKTIRPIR